MTKELEALDWVENVFEEHQVQLPDVELTLIRQALTPPTADEVCKALSEYDYFDEVNYDASTRGFYSEDTICYLGIDYQRTPIIIFEYDLPPHLITMIGKFYESLEGEK